MKIDYLEIRSRFKNLENVVVDFDENNLMTVIVGRNGSGKSNVLEALVSIFRNLDLGEEPPFSYKIKYKLGEESNTQWITIDADPARGTLTKQYTVNVSNHKEKESKGYKEETVAISKIKRDSNGLASLLPNYLFAYYSGPSDRLEKYFRKHRTDFYKRLLKNEVDLKADIRPLFYAKPYHSQFVLLAFFLSDKNDEEKKFLREHLGIEGLDSIHFVLRKPGWVKKKYKEELFWGARGVVREFLDSLYPYALAPVKVTRKEDTSLTGSNVNNEFFHLFLPDVGTLREFAKGLRPDVFFKMLESMLLSEIIAEVNVRVKMVAHEAPLTFRELSEGEQQLLTVLGLLKFTGGKDSLFLLDEPDTHLNPTWAVKYLKFLREFVPNNETSHLLMVTHQPLAIAELQKEQVQVMWKDEINNVHSQEPEEDPQGMGYAGILTSDMFGLRGTLDEPTEDLLREKRDLLEKPKLSKEDVDRMHIVDEKLVGLRFTTTHWDSDYQEYLQARKQVAHELFAKDNASPEIQKLRKKKALEILRKIKSKEHLEVVK
ncbi:MAG: AAA family ATPase [Fibrobacter sp.]|nr:AAA family ATPase [Fibrobacter sp.]